MVGLDRGPRGEIANSPWQIAGRAVVEWWTHPQRCGGASSYREKWRVNAAAPLVIARRSTA